MDAEVFCDLLDRHAGFAVTSDAHNVVTELGGVWLGHSNILPNRPPGQVRSDVTYPCSSPFREKVDGVNVKLAAITDRINRAYAESVENTILAADDPGAAFLVAPVDAQRSVIRLLTEVIIIPAAGRRGKNWPSDPEASKVIAATRVRLIPTGPLVA